MATAEERARAIVEGGDWDQTEGLHGSPIDYEQLTRLIADQLRADEARIAELTAWIRHAGERAMVCTYEILGEVCEGCRCERAHGAPQAASSAARLRQMIQSGVVVMDPAWMRDAQGSMRLVEVSLVAGEPQARE
jgi:hypothetical protein